MGKTILNIKMDPETKREIQAFAAELGVPVSVIMNAQIRQMLRDRKIVLSTELEPTPYLEKIMDQVEADIAANQNLGRTFVNAREAARHLDSLSKTV